MRRRAIGLAAVVALYGCAASRAPQVDLAREEATIRQLTTDWFAAEMRRDMEGSMAFLAPGAIIQTEGAPAIITAEGMRALYKDFFALPYTSIAITEPRTIVVAPSGDMAYDVGPWKMISTTKTGTREDLGKSTIIWKKANGQWKAVVMAFSGDTPPAPPAGK